jgi:hypothetical protein
MEKFYNAVCWVGIGILVVFGVPLFLLRYVVSPIWGFAWLLSNSALPWWERVLAAAAIIAGIAYLISRSSRRGIPRNHNFAYYTPPKHPEEHSASSLKAKKQ